MVTVPDLAALLAAQRPWPAVREELRLSDGAPDAAGRPSWTLHDPVRHRFVRVDWPTMEILRRWWLADAAAIAAAVSRETTLELDEEDVRAVLTLARREGLVQPDAPAAEDGTPAWRRHLTWLLHHYLFFRVPLLRPQRLLDWLLPRLAWLAAPGFTAASIVAALVGAIALLDQGSALQAQWLDLLSWRGALLYGLTLVLVKVAHELAHALVARHHGCAVPTMGVAFVVMWPLAYTDTTEAWRLADRRARFAIAAAGVRAELTVAAWATFAWALLPDGAARTAAFVLGTMSWVTTVLVNLSPFMRFDGYFLLCDALDMPNLHDRAFAQARAWLRRLLLGWQDEPAEHFGRAARHALVAFALATWLWRLSLYLAIAWAVYSFGFKLLGTLLLIVELGWFIAAPVLRELQAWRKGHAAWRGQRRARLSSALLAGAALLALWPYAGSGVGAAVVQPAQTLAVTLPAVARIERVEVSAGQGVRAGQTLLQASTPAIERQEATARAAVERLQREVAAAALGGEGQARWGALQAELQTARAQAAQAAQDLAQLAPTAPFDAVVTDVDPSLAAGTMSPPAHQALLHLAAPQRWEAVAYVDETVARSLRPGQAGWIGLDSRPWTRERATVVSVTAQPSATIAEPLLVRANGGAIAARETSNGWVPAQSWYRVVLALDEPLALSPRRWRGHATLVDEPASLATRAWRRVSEAWMREAGF